MQGMTKLLDVKLRAGLEREHLLTFRMEVPVNVFPMGELVIRPAPGSNVFPLHVRNVQFLAGTDGVVDVSGNTISHTVEMAERFLREHPDVTDLSVVRNA